jgi:WD40 repeat protein
LKTQKGKHGRYVVLIDLSIYLVVYYDLLLLNTYRKVSGRAMAGSMRAAERGGVMWDVHVGEVVAEYKGHTGCIYALHMAGEFGTIATGSGDHTVRVWDSKTGRCEATLLGHRGSVTSK